MSSNETTMLEELTELAAASEDLKKALIGRDTDAIWDAVAAQDALAREITANHRPPTVQDAAERKLVIDLVARIKRAQATNTALAGSFLRLVERTMTSLSAGARPGASTYGASGAIDAKAAPILIQQNV